MLLEDEELWGDGRLMGGVFQLLRALGAHRHAQVGAQAAGAGGVGQEGRGREGRAGWQGSQRSVLW